MNPSPIEQKNGWCYHILFIKAQRDPRPEVAELRRPDEWYLFQPMYAPLIRVPNHWNYCPLCSAPRPEGFPPEPLDNNKVSYEYESESVHWPSAAIGHIQYLSPRKHAPENNQSSDGNWCEHVVWTLGRRNENDWRLYGGEYAQCVFAWWNACPICNIRRPNATPLVAYDYELAGFNPNIPKNPYSVIPLH